MDNNKNIESVFEEEGTCMTCGRIGVDKFWRIIDSCIKYGNQFVLIVEVMKKILNFEPTNLNYSMEVCENCKKKLQEFYNFRMRFEEMRKISKEAAIEILEVDSDSLAEEEQSESINQTDFIVSDKESSVEEEYVEDFIEDYEDESVRNENQESSRRKRFPDQWACNQRKTLRNSGKSCK